ncbi:MAG: phosphoglycerate kinase, partial [Candidatus Vogelbacteria bacterium CG10_big_fil_rev_8_21_14_0_10_45_14]
MKELPDIESLGGLRGKRVVLHAGMNVPVAGGLVVNDFRLKRLLPTLKMLSLAGARTIVIGHLGSEEPKTVEPIAKYFEGELKVRFLGKPPHTLLAKEVNAKDGEVLFAENVRMSPGELECDELLGKHIASLGDVYVNEDFAVSHRPHASIVIPPRYIPCAFGPDFIKEVSELSKVEDPPRPFVAFIGGA